MQHESMALAIRTASNYAMPSSQNCQMQSKLGEKLNNHRLHNSKNRGIKKSQQQTLPTSCHIASPGCSKNTVTTGCDCWIRTQAIFYTTQIAYHFTILLFAASILCMYQHKVSNPKHVCVYFTGSHTSHPWQRIGNWWSYFSIIKFYTEKRHLWSHLWCVGCL